MKLITVRLIDGVWKQEETEVPESYTDQQKRVEQMAEAEPGRVVVGWNVNRPEIEDEAYLDQL